MVNFIETFCFSDSSFHNLEYHRARVLRTLHSQAVWNEIHSCLNDMPVSEWRAAMRCTVEYNEGGVVASRFVEYEKREIKRLIPIVSDVDYHLKYADRTELNRLKSIVAEGEEPLIVQNGLVTDTTFANVVFRCHDGRLVTPRKPLLEGTKRAKLLADCIISEQDITLADLAHFQTFYLINAMRDIDVLSVFKR